MPTSMMATNIRQDRSNDYYAENGPSEINQPDKFHGEAHKGSAQYEEITK